MDGLLREETIAYGTGFETVNNVDYRRNEMKTMIIIRAMKSTGLLNSPLCLALAATLSASASAQSEAPTLVRVEEDWVALIAEPDTATSSPQILNVISPRTDVSTVFGMVQVNHRGSPGFQEGGLQVQGWNGSLLVQAMQANKSAILNRNSDRVQYTIAMEKVTDGIKFELLNGRSRTWGRFAQTPLAVTVPVNISSLDGYSPDFSVSSTGVNLGAHRVDLLYIAAVRSTFSDGQTVTDDTDRVIHRYQNSVEDVPLAEYEQNLDEYNLDITE